MIDDLRPEPTTQDLVDEIDRLRARMLRHGNVVGAAAALLNAIHRAGGYQVTDPANQERIQRSMQALEAAVVEALG